MASIVMVANFTSGTIVMVVLHPNGPPLAENHRAWPTRGVFAIKWLLDGIFPVKGNQIASRRFRRIGLMGLPKRWSVWTHSTQGYPRTGKRWNKFARLVAKKRNEHKPNFRFFWRNRLSFRFTVCPRHAATGFFYR